MVTLRPRGRPLSILVAAALVLLASMFLGVLASSFAERVRPPLEHARVLARSGRFAEAERAYLDLARLRPASTLVLVELVDNHQRLAFDAALAKRVRHADDVLGPIGDAAVAAAIHAPDLPPDVALLGRFWDKVTRGVLTGADRAEVAAAADDETPMPWANHLLGREALDDDREGEAVERFVREASAFDDRHQDADAACAQWISEGQWSRLAAALAHPRFARQVSGSLRMQEALTRRDWRGVGRWFFPSQYEGATLGIGLLALASSLVWFGICAQIGLWSERPRARVPLYLAAFALGVASTYVTLALGIVEHAFGFVEKKQTLADLIYFVVGVGLREELSKALLFLPLVPILVRWGRRREAFACGALIGLGFAAEENIGYFHMGLSTALARFLTANFLHMSTTGLVAVTIDDYARGRDSEPAELSRTLMTVVVAHGLYDFFLSSVSVDAGSFLSMFVFILLTRRFVAILRELPGREGPLARRFCLGLALVAGATFIYACTLVSPQQAGLALFEGALGLAIVAFMFVQELRRL